MRGVDEIEDEVVDAAEPARIEVVETVARPPRASRPGIVTTGRLERRLWQRLRSDAVLVEMSSGTAEGAAHAVDEVLRRGADALVSFGVAAALAPVVTPGRLILGHAVVLSGGRTVPTDPVWRGALARQLQALGTDPLEARIAGVDRLSGSSVERFRCFQSTFAAAADTESHLVAAAAERHGLPFVVLRVAVDCLQEPALGGRSLGVTAGGRWRRGLIHGLARPWQAAEAVRISRRFDRVLDLLELTVPVVATSLSGAGESSR